MSLIRPDVTISQLVVEKPSRSEFFEMMGIDYCCGGKRCLLEVCSAKGISVEELMEHLARFDKEKELFRTDEENWNESSFTQLIEHITQVHHVYTRQALKRLITLVYKVASVHGDTHPELLEVRQIFTAMSDELEMHMQKEENVLFPYSIQLDSAESVPPMHCGGVQHPIKVMLYEHEETGKQLEALRQLTNNYTPPEDACNTYRAMLHGLSQLEADIHMHVHKENNILFPKILNRVAQLESGGCTLG